MTADLAIVGAGPAGMAAATLAAELGLDTLLIDEQDAPGGQIYRAVEFADPASPLGRQYLAGRPLVTALRASHAQYRPNTAVWHIQPPDGDGPVALSLAAGANVETVEARRVLLATGAIERPAPIPGWTLPGVMSAGGAQILLKASGIVPEGRAVLAGQGPLLYLLAGQLSRAGAPPIAIIDTTPAENYAAAAQAVRALWPGRRSLFEGLGLIAAARRAGIPIRRGARGLRAVGRNRLERIVWEGGDIAADHLFLHDGVIPNVQIGLALQLDHRWDEAQLCWRPQCDLWGRTSRSAILIAGDGGGILGAEAAAASGRLAALAVATELGRISEAERDARAKPLRRVLDRERTFRRFLDRLYRPVPETLVPPDDAIVVCRCEEVTVGAIRNAVRLGAPGPNQLKAFTRCGMGPCQGRICGPVVATVIADALGMPPGEIGTFRPRAPYVPLTVGALAGLV